MRRACAVAWLLMLVASLGARARVPNAPLPTGSTPLLVQSQYHQVQFYVSVPAGWPTGRPQGYPVLLTLTPTTNSGNSTLWTNYHAAFASYRDSHSYPFVIVTPLLFDSGSAADSNQWQNNGIFTYTYPPGLFTPITTNTLGWTFDQDGIQAIATRDAAFGNWLYGSGRVYLSMFSGSGNTGYMSLLSNPEYFAGFVATATNYGGRAVTSEVPANRSPISTHASRLTLPGKLFIGEDDPFRGAPSNLDTQMASILSVFAANQYNAVNQTITEVAGEDHNAIVASQLPYLNGLVT